MKAAEPTPAGWSGEDASGPTRGGRYSTPKALMSDEKPIEAEFVPRRVQTLGDRLGINRMLPETAGPKTTAPPPVSPKFAREAIATANADRLGRTGEAGVRVPPGSRELPAPPNAAPPTPPPSVDPKFARQAIRSMQDATRLGTKGNHGVRVSSEPLESARRPSAGALPPPATIESLGLVDKGEVVKGSGIRQFELKSAPGKTVAMKPAQLAKMSPHQIAEYVKTEVAKKASAPTAEELKARMFSTQ